MSCLPNTYAYNNDGIRIEKRENGNIHTYTLDGTVLSSIFRKFVSDKMKLRTGIPVMERLRSA